MPIASRAPVSLTLLALLFGSKLAAADLFNDPSGVPEVLTATRLKQSPAEVPGSISVLDRELIVASGARDIPELMRLVPGMMVGYLSGNQPTVNYHGTSMSGARRLQVLIDGRSVYRPGLASVDWSDLPLALEDVERIEVFRGPNTVSYGANALMGVINIITRAPGESPGTRLKYTAGQRGIRDWYASQSIALEDSDFRLSLSGQEDDGFDHDHDGHALRDGRRLSRFNLNASHSLAPNQSLEWQLATQVLDQLRNGGLRPVCGRVDRNIRESRYDLEMQDTLSLGDNLRLLNGLSYRYDQANSETFYGGRVSSQIWRLFSQLEWHAGEHWLLQGGGMLEDVEGSGSSFSPRLAVNYLFNPQHSLRAVYSEAVRSPGMYENDVDWRYRVRHLTPAPYGQSEAYYFASAHGPGDLGKEHTRSREIGYNGFFRETGLAMDVRLFHEEITGLISDPLSVVDFSPDNGDRIRFSGAEGQLDWRLGLRDRLRATYAYLDYDATSRYDRRLTARHGGSAGWMHDWGQGWSSALFYYGDDSLNGHRFERVDLRLAKRIPLGKAALELAGVLQQRLDDQPLTFPDNRYDSRHLLYFSAEVTF
ncbi:TonB-dependent receptor plug domain-containing protein [Pseudomonas aeruginosa]|uniref:TonB-dependent receptor plug domain-containing protein n=1 Tax=Pseudomonas aeruginosa TaxID=287 RepID=UPI0034E06E77